MQYTLYDIYVAPFVRDFGIFFPTFLMWFVLQWCAPRALARVFGSLFTRLSKEQQTELSVRMVSVCNGLLMTGAALCFASNFYAQRLTFCDDHYKEIAGYRFFRVAIVSYFAWDIVVCFVYRWGVIWKIHAISSFVGAYLLSFPIFDQYGSYFAGMFELSNAPLHLSVILRTLNSAALHSFADVLEKIFALCFLVIRVVGGSFVSFMWLRTSCAQLVANLRSRGKLFNHEGPIVMCVVLLLVIQFLQYVWCAAIVRGAVSRFRAAGNAKKKAKKM